MEPDRQVGRSAEEFVASFEEGWHLPKPEPFLAHFKARMTSDVRLVQPLARPTRGQAEFERLFRGTSRFSPTSSRTCTIGRPVGTASRSSSR